MLEKRMKSIIFSILLILSVSPSGFAYHPVFLLGGLVYSVTDSFDLSGGIKTGLNSAETDLGVLAGITVRF